jgi:hypothetical protein
LKPLSFRRNPLPTFNSGVSISMSSSPQRWALYIDIQGFGSKWNDTTMEAFRGINALMQGIFWIGDRYYRAPPERLFAHQFGDGFLVISDFPEERLDRAALVGVALMRHLLTHGETAKGAISEGEISDVKNCYPNDIREQFGDWNIRLGEGVMTVTPVLGSALINTVGLEKKCPSGPLLAIPTQEAHRLDCGIAISHASDKVSILNWLRGEPTGLKELQTAAGLKQLPEQERRDLLERYIRTNEFLKKEWKDNARRYLLE